MAQVHDIRKKLKFTARLLCGSVIFIGFAVIAGWLLDIEFLKRPDSYTPTINPAAAVLFIISGISLMLVIRKEFSLKQKKVSQLLSVFVILVALIQIFSILSGIEIPVDELLFRDKLYDPGRKEMSKIAFNTALNFFLSGLAIFTIDSYLIKRRNLAELFCIVITLISILNLYGYVYGVKYIYGATSFLSMALFSTISFLLISISILFSRPERGAVALITGEDPGEVIFWRLFALFFPFIFGWLELWGVKHQYYSKEFGTALLAMITYAITVFLLGRESVIKHKLRKLRRKTEKIIEEDARRLRSILDNSSAIIYIKDLSGKFITVNKQFENFYKIKKEIVEGRTANDIFSSRQINITDKEEEVIRTGEAHKVEETFISEDQFYSLITVRFPLLDIKGTMYAVCGISTDITKLKKYELELIEKEKELRAIIDNVGEGISVADSTGIILVNKMGQTIAGRSGIQLSPEEWSARFHIYYPDGKRPFPSEKLPLFKALNGESSDDVEILIKTSEFPEGRKLIVTGRPVVKEDGNILGVVVYRDVTEWRKLEEKLRESEKYLKTILENLGEGVIVAESDGRISFLNKKAEEILGGKEQIQKFWREWPETIQIYYPDGKTPYSWKMLPLSKAIQGEATDNVLILFKSPSFPAGLLLNVTGRPIKKEDGSISGIIVFKDIH